MSPPPPVEEGAASPSPIQPGFPLLPVSRGFRLTVQKSLRQFRTLLQAKGIGADVTSNGLPPPVETPSDAAT